MEQRTNEDLAAQISLNSLIISALLSGFKLYAGISGHSSAMVSDGVHSVSDALSLLATAVKAKASAGEPDQVQPVWGKRLEQAVLLLLSSILLVIGLTIGIASFIVLLRGYQNEPTVPNPLALVAAIDSIAVEEGLNIYNRNVANKIDSELLRSDAGHHQSNALFSVVCFAGIAGSRMGLPLLDALVGMIICSFIVKEAVDLFKKAIGRDD